MISLQLNLILTFEKRMKMLQKMHFKKLRSIKKILHLEPIPIQSSQSIPNPSDAACNELKCLFFFRHLQKPQAVNHNHFSDRQLPRSAYKPNAPFRTSQTTNSQANQLSIQQHHYQRKTHSSSNPKIFIFESGGKE